MLERSNFKVIARADIVTAVIALALFLGFTQTKAIGSNSIKYKEYVNVRYCFAIEYPADLLKPQGESDNSDGQSFKSQYGAANLSAWGCHAIDSAGEAKTLEQDFKEELTERKSQTTYQASGKSWYVISGKDKQGSLFYEKTLLKDGDFKKFVITYPASEAKLYQPIVERVARTFHSTTPVQYGTDERPRVFPRIQRAR